MQSGARIIEAPVAGIDEEQPLTTMPVAIMPMDQPIMMVNYPTRGPSYLQTPTHRLQPLQAYNSFGDEVYYQYMDPAQERKPRRGTYNRKLNAIENWASLTQGLVELGRDLSYAA